MASRTDSQDRMQPPPADPRRPAREAAHAALKAATQLQAAGRTAEAEAAFRRALAIDPHSAQACNNLGHHLLAEGRTSEAEALFRHALRIRPHYARALLNLGCILGQRSADAQEAVAMLEEATRLEPDLFHAWNNLGTALTTLCQAEAAEAAYRHAMTLEPRNPAAPLNLGALFFAAGRPAEAEAWFRQALALDPAMAEARINLCFALLAQGRLREAWPLHAARAGIARAKSQTHWPDLPMPHWQGESLAGKSIMVWPEQGYGDYIQFVRFVGALRARGASRITLVCTPPLHALLETVEGVDRVVSGVADVPAHDYWAFVMSLPQGLDIGLEDIPAALPYIRAPADRLARWRGFLPAGAADGLRVGLAWKGSAGHRNDANRSLPGLATLAPLWSVPGVRFVGLQKGKLPGLEDPDALAPPAGQPMLSMGPGMADFADLAAVVDQLDLVITVDTAVAHVAGALGKPVWVLLPAWGTDWRWMQDREDSPWYPGVMRLFRQRRHGDWTEVVDRVAGALAALATARRPTNAAGLQEADRLVREGRLDEAAPLLRGLVEAGQATARVHHLLAHIASRHGATAEAEAQYRAGLALDDRQAGLHSDLGVLLMNVGRLGEAEACYRRAVAVDPACIEAWMNLAVMERFGGRFAESEAAWREALRLDPARPVARVGLGHLLLALGRLQEAWPWLRARHDPVFDRFGTRVPQLPFPRWEGEPLAGRTILLWPEQGMGDVIQFARYASLLRGMGAKRVTLAAPPALVELLRSLADVDAVVSASESVAPHDTWAFLMDLPDRLGTTLANLPARVPYLRADGERVRSWRPRLPAGTLRVGLVWKGAAVNPNDKQRSLPGLAALAPLWHVPGVAFVSLQKGAGEDEATQPPAGQPLAALGRELRDFADTAAVIDSLDLVIGVDTSVLHLAAALGKPAWILLPAWGTDWRWLVDREDSPWYPGVVRLFRQREPGQWAAVIGEVAAALGTYAEHARAAPGAARPIALQLAVRSGRVVRPHDAERARLADNDYAAATRLWKQGRPAEAEALYRVALERDPAHASAHNNLANLMREQRRLDEAEAQYRLALQADPRHLHALTNLGSLLAMQRRPDEAEPLLREALAVAPDSVDVLSNLGTLLDDVGRRDEAEALYARALSLDPDHAGALSNLGSLLMHQGRLEEAERHIRRALELQPRMTEALINLAFLLRAQGRPAEAESTYRRALDIEPGNSLAELNLCFLLLAQGRLREAWPLHGARLQPQRRQVNTRVPTFGWPQWRGESLQGRSLVIWPEQGLGDAIQFLRYARLLKQRGLARLTVVCQPSLAPLLRTLEGVDAVEVNVSAVQPHDYWVLLMDLPERFDTTLETIPADLPYLRPDPARVARWSPRLPAGRRVGLVWRGSPGHRNDAHRSLPGLATLAPLWRVRGVQFISLQKGAGEDEAAQPPAGQPLVDLGRHFGDFADAAAVISQLDLVICVDTSVAHLAGALGKPVWLLLPRLGTDWRWLTGREDSPWYPGVMRLFRQRVVDDWTEVVDRIAQALPGFLATVRPQSTPEAGLAADREVTRALALAGGGKPMLAEVAYRRALAIVPGHAGALNNLAVLLAGQGRAAEAEACWREALAAHPDDGACLYNFGSHLADSERLDEALGLLRRAALAWPAHASVRNNLARLLDRLGRLDEALAEYARAHALAPRHTGVLANHAAALMAAGRPAQAEPLLREAIAIAPDATDLQASQAVVLRALGRPREAESLLREALARHPAHIPARLGLALLLLAEGRFQEAWPFYEARHEGPAPASGSPAPPDAAFRWKGEPLAGGTLVIWHEQGFGDAIQFIRYAALAKARAGGRVVASCPASLAALFARADGVDAVFTQPSECPPLAAWAWLGDLPRLLGTTLESIPAALPYLHADPARQQRWAPRLPPGRRAGLVWKGRADYANDAHRSLPGLHALAPLWQVPGWSFVSLQKGPGAEDAMDPPDAQPLRALGHDLEDFADAAAVISQLDLVITVDTAVAHLAGALGKPVWVLLPAQGTDWRWMTGRDDSPWYPGVMRLFRQRQPLAWTDVIAEVVHALGRSEPRGDHAEGPAGEAEAHYQRGNALRDAGRWREAAAAYHEAIAMHAAHAGAHHNLGVVRQAVGDTARAMEAYRRALALAPDHAITLTNLGSLLLEAGQLNEAEPLLRAAIRSQPDYAKPHIYLADLLARRQAPEAEAAYQAALSCDPGWAKAHSQWGAWLTRAGRWAEAEASLRDAIERDATSVDAWIHLAVLLDDLHRDGESETAWREALQRSPAHPRARLGLGLHLLRQERFAEAWPFHAARHDPVFRHFGTTPPEPAWPRWSGEPLAGRSLVIWPEQGHGDLLQFIRYAPLLKTMGLARLTVLCRPELADLVRAVEGVDEVVTDEAALRAHDLWACLMDLPERVGTTLATLPARLPYLQADHARRARWRPHLPEGPRIGLVWRGRPAHDNDAQRSLASLTALAPLWAAAAGRARFISLQKGAGEDEALSPPAAQPLLALGHRCADFADAAAVVAELDLVITVDTAMAHLAGGLGKPVWVLLPAHGCDWRWFHERSDSPWYPSVMRLFRQPLDEAGWSGTVDRVAGELAQWLAARPGAGAPDAQALPPTAVPAPADAARPPSTPEALFHQAALMGAAGDHAGAEAAYREGLARQPDHVGALNNLGLLLVHRGALAEAEAVYRRGLAAEPAHETLLLNLGTLLGDLRRTDEAESLLRRAAQARPTHAKPLNNLGRLLARAGRAADAEAAYRQAIALDTAHQSAARTNLAILLARSGRFAEAEALARESVARQPKVAEHWLGLGSVLRHARRDVEAEAALRQALSLQPAHATAQLALSHLLLAQGRFEEGFALHGARRLWRPGSAMALPPELPWPEWTGQPLHGRSIVVWQEQGLGDALQFVRFASLLKPLGASTVTLHCHPALAPLLQAVAGIDRIVAQASDCGPHDYWVMMLDLPRLLGTTVDRIPAALPYLQADPSRAARWAPRLPAGRKVGLVWRGAPGQENDDLRSLTGLEVLAPLWQVPGLQFVSLQKGEGEAQALQPPAGQPLAALGHGFEDMMDTAAVVSQLDLVITVCTSVAHLAGALGKPTWVLLPAIGADWRWLLDRDDSPWYPGVMRLFRSRQPGDWTAAVAAVRDALAAWSQPRG